MLEFYNDVLQAIGEGVKPGECQGFFRAPIIATWEYGWPEADPAHDEELDDEAADELGPLTDVHFYQLMDAKDWPEDVAKAALQASMPPDWNGNLGTWYEPIPTLAAATALESQGIIL